MSQDEKIRVLLIEDNPVDIEWVKSSLEEFGQKSFQLDCVKSLEEGMERLSRNGYEVLLLDLSLPDSSGYETFERVMAEYRRLPLVVCSVTDNAELAIRAVQQGAQDYLVKGTMDSRILPRVIRYAIERKKIQEELRKRTEELEHVNKIMVARELKMMQLKREMELLKKHDDH